MRSPDCRHDERVDLDERRVGRDERPVDRLIIFTALPTWSPDSPSAERELTRLKRLQPQRGVDERLEDALRRLFGDLLDLDAAVRAHHQHGPLGRAVDHEAQVQLAGDLEAFFDEHAADDPALRPGLVGDQRHAEHGVRGGLRSVRALDDLDAAALAAATGVNLCFDDDRAAAELDGGGARVVYRVRDARPRDGHAERLEDVFALIFVDLHAEREVYRQSPSWGNAGQSRKEIGTGNKDRRRLKIGAFASSSQRVRNAGDRAGGLSQNPRLRRRSEDNPRD